MTDWSAYAGRWIALDEAHHVVGVGLKPEEAERAGRQNRPKEHFELVWISPHPPHLALPAWPFVPLDALLAQTPVWLAGGAVRDLLLDRPLHDWDFTVAGPARGLARRVANALEGAYVTLDDERDTGRVVVTEPKRQQLITLDFAALRGDSIEDDLRRRDFTINALALTREGALIDPTNGARDLQAGLIRATGPYALADDPARLLRAVRACGELHFRLEPETERLVKAHAPALAVVTPERIRAELLRILALDAAAPTLQQANELGLLARVLPEATALQAVAQSRPHHYRSAWEHSLAALTATEGLLCALRGRPHSKEVARRVPAPTWAWERLERALVPLQAPLLAYLETPLAAELSREALLKWGALLHDVGKAVTRTVGDDGLTHFYGHSERGGELVFQRLTALRFPNKARDFVVMLIQEHMRLIGAARQPLSRRASYRFFRDTGEAGPGVILLALADALAVWGPRLEEARWQALLAAAETLLHTYVHKQAEVINPPPLLNGHDLMALGIKPGPALGALLAALQEAQAAGEVQTREQADDYIKGYLHPQEESHDID